MNASNPFDRIYYINSRKPYSDSWKRAEFYIPELVQFDPTTLSVVIDGVVCGTAEQTGRHYTYTHTIAPFNADLTPIKMHLSFFCEEMARNINSVGCWDITHEGEYISDYISEDGLKIQIACA
jgi:hypothetical protein